MKQKERRLNARGFDFMTLGLIFVLVIFGLAAMTNALADPSSSDMTLGSKLASLNLQRPLMQLAWFAVGLVAVVVISLADYQVFADYVRYATFKIYVEERDIETEDLLSDMLKYAKFYQVLRVGNTTSAALNSCIYRLNRLETAVTRPFFLEVLRLNAENALSLDEVTQIFLTCENYVFRRLICDLPTNALNKIFLMLHKEIMRYDGSADQYFEKFKFAMLSKKERVRFPDDTEFAAAFAAKPMYMMNSKNKHYLFQDHYHQRRSQRQDCWPEGPHHRRPGWRGRA